MCYSPGKSINTSVCIFSAEVFATSRKQDFPIQNIGNASSNNAFTGTVVFALLGIKVQLIGSDHAQ